MEMTHIIHIIWTTEEKLELANCTSYLSERSFSWTIYRKSEWTLKRNELNELEQVFHSAMRMNGCLSEIITMAESYKKNKESLKGKCVDLCWASYWIWISFLTSQNLYEDPAFTGRGYFVTFSGASFSKLNMLHLHCNIAHCTPKLPFDKISWILTAYIPKKTPFFSSENYFLFCSFMLVVKPFLCTSYFYILFKPSRTFTFPKTN